MVTRVDWSDVAAFVAAYLDGRSGVQLEASRLGNNLLDELTDAYLRDRDVPVSMRGEVMAMVDSVL